MKKDLDTTLTPVDKNAIIFDEMEKTRTPAEAGVLLSRMIPKNTKIFRIYESSDFQTQWAVEMWAEAIKARKEVRFWAYTRNFSLDFSSLTQLPNFSLLAATDRHNIKEAKRFVKKYKVRHAYGPWGHRDGALPKSKVCPISSGKLDVENGCAKCMYCIIKRNKKDIVFISC